MRPLMDLRGGLLQGLAQERRLEVNPLRIGVVAGSDIHNSLAAFAIGADGQLSPLGHTLDVPAVPRGFGLSPDGRWLVCAGQKAGTLNAYRIDPATGRLTDTKQSVAAGAACCIVFAR